jgi:hypothetical protein
MKNKSDSKQFYIKFFGVPPKQLKIFNPFQLCILSLSAILSLVGGPSISAQPGSTTFKYPITLENVDYLAPSGFPDYKLTISKDYGPNTDTPNPIFSDLAWKTPDMKTPVAFISGKAIRAVAQFNLNGCTKEVWAKGDGPGSYDPPVQKLNNTGKYNPVALPAIFPANIVDFYDPFEVTWYISDSPNGPWKKVGKSENPLYVTYTPPILPAVGIEFFHSVLYYGYKYAKGQTDPDLIVNNMYSAFASKTVPRRDDPTVGAMTYWAWPDPPGQGANFCFFTTKNLLMFENSRCGAWAYFFDDMIRAQGISGSVISEVTYNPGSGFVANLSSDITSFFGPAAANLAFAPSIEPCFFVNSYNVNSHKFYTWNMEYNPIVDVTVPGLGMIPVSNGPVIIGSNTMNFGPKSGIGGQGNTDPQSTFPNHALVKYNNKYYDPSYGSPICATKIEWENISITGGGAAYGEIVYIDNSGFFPIAYLVMYQHKPNSPGTLELTINP